VKEITFDRKGASYGVWIMVAITIIFFVFAIAAIILRNAPANMGSPDFVADYYRNIFYERDEVFRDPLVLVFMLFVPFLAVFGLSWGLLSLLEPFKTKQGANAAAVIAAGFALYSIPAVSTVLNSFVPWGLTFAVIMLVVGIIATAVNYGVIPWIKTAGDINKEGKEIKSAGKSWWERGEEEKEEKDDKTLGDNIDNFYDKTKREFLINCDNAINNTDIDAAKICLKTIDSYKKTCEDYYNKLRKSKMENWEKLPYIRELNEIEKLLKDKAEKLDKFIKTFKPEAPIPPAKSREELKNRLLEKVRELEVLKEDAAKVGVIIPQKEIDETIHLAETGSPEAIQAAIVHVEKNIEEIKKRLESSKSEKETITNELAEKIKKAEELGMSKTEIQSFKIIVEKGTLEQKKHAIRDLDGWINSQKGKGEVPKEIPSNIVNLHSEFRRCIDGIYNYMEDLHNRTDKWKTKSKAMQELWRTSQAYLNVYKEVKSIALNTENFYRFIVNLSSGRKMILVNWFHFLPKSLDEIENAAKQLESKRDEVEDKEFIKLVDIILNEILGAETFKLFETLREVYHSMTSEAENLKRAK